MKDLLLSFSQPHPVLGTFVYVNSWNPHNSFEGHKDCPYFTDEETEASEKLSLGGSR